VKIISGAQTGVDRAALDVALKHGIDCGGWCPAGRRDELGRIPDRYPMSELPGGSYADRTRANVRDSQASIIFYCREIEGGTKYAMECCRELNRPYLLIDAASTTEQHSATAVVAFVREHKIDIVGVGGPRASEWPDGYDYAYRVLERFLNCSRPA
jgi:hypothetical protein